MSSQFGIHERDSGGRDSRARREVGTLRLSGRGFSQWSQVQERCLLTYPAIFNMSMLATGKMVFNFASGLIVRPALSLFFLMYTQICFVTSVRGRVLAPQIAARASLSFFGAKMPFFAFFMAAAIFLPLAFAAALPRAFFVALSVAIVAFFVVVVVTVFFVVVVIAIEGCKCTHALSL